jgi:hypothetical protein
MRDVSRWRKNPTSTVAVTVSMKSSPTTKRYGSPL